MIIVWVQSSTPPVATYGGDLSADDLQYEKEYWKPRTTFRYMVLLFMHGKGHDVL